MEIIVNDERLRELHDEGVGLIFNNFGGDGQTDSGRDFNKLHRASCEHCDPGRDRNAMTVRTSGRKIWFASMSEAAEWLRDNGIECTRCARCDPR